MHLAACGSVEWLETTTAQHYVPLNHNMEVLNVGKEGETTQKWSGLGTCASSTISKVHMNVCEVSNQCSSLHLNKVSVSP